MLDFDLQRFDDEETVSNAEENSASESSTEQAELPEGFEGLEEYKDEILAEIAETQKSEENSQAEDSSGEIVAGQKVPYERFKSKVDEVAALKAQIDEMKRQGVQPAQQQQTPPPVQNQLPQIPQQRQPPQQAQVPMPQMQLTPETMGKLKQAVTAEAMRMTKMTPEQVKELEFAEEGNAELERWRFANQLATDNILSQVRQIQRNQQAQARQLLETHADAVKNFNEFAAKEMQSPTYQETVDFAIGELFDSLPPAQQRAIANSYVRVEKQIASAEEIALVQAYYAQAKTLLQAKKNQLQPQPAKSKPKANMPKVDQLNGSNGNGTQTMTAADLERIIDSTTDFDKLDPKIKKMFEG